MVDEIYMPPCRFVRETQYIFSFTTKTIKNLYHNGLARLLRGIIPYVHNIII